MNQLLLLAQNNNGMTDAEAAAAGAAALGGLIAVVLTMLAVMLIVAIIICSLLYIVLKAVPAEHRKLEPGLVFLMLIPIFALVWGFFVFQRIPESYKSYFSAQGRTDVGDCGKGIGLALAICYACTIVPCLNYVAGPATLVLFIIFVIKMFGYKKEIDAAHPPMPGPTPPAAA